MSSETWKMIKVFKPDIIPIKYFILIQVIKTFLLDAFTLKPCSGCASLVLAAPHRSMFSQWQRVYLHFEFTTAC